MNVFAVAVTLDAAYAATAAVEAAVRVLTVDTNFHPNPNFDRLIFDEVKIKLQNTKTQNKK